MQYIPNIIGFFILVMGAVLSYYAYLNIKKQKAIAEANSEQANLIQ